MNELVKASIDLLPPAERGAYESYVDRGGKSLSPPVQASLFNLYLNGSSCDEIQRLNPNFTLGMIVKAKVEGLWDERREAHVRELLETVRERVQQVQLESVSFTADLLSSANKMFGDKLKRYIQTGNASELGDLKIDSLKQYKDAVDLLLKLTGQDRESTMKLKGEVTQTVEFKGKMTPAQAAALLADHEK